MAHGVAWELQADQGWAQQVAEFRSKLEGATVVLFGLCPYCHEPMSAPVTVGPAVRMGAVAAIKVLEAPAVPPAEYVVWCNCTGDHKGRPSDQTGCGRYGLLQVTS